MIGLQKDYLQSEGLPGLKSEMRLVAGIFPIGICSGDAPFNAGNFEEQWIICLMQDMAVRL